MSTELPLPPHISALARSESNPSSTMSEKTAVHLSPQLPSDDIALRLEGGGSLEAEIADIKKSFGRLYSSKSLPKMKDSRMVQQGDWKTRALSGTDGKTTIVMPRPAPVSAKSTPPPQLANTRSSRQDAPPKSGGFSAFLRKLTGRSVSPKVKALPAPQQMQENSSTSAPTRPAIPAARSISTTNVPTKPVLMPLDVKIRRDHFAPASAPAAPQPGAIVADPVPPVPCVSQEPEIVPQEIESTVQTTDPCEIPLPASPELSLSLGENELDDVASDDVLSPAEAVTSSKPTASAEPTASSEATAPVQPAAPLSRSESTLKRTKQTPMLSLEGFDIKEEDEDEESVSETKDTLRELRPIPIPSGGPRSAVESLAPDTPGTTSSTLEEIVTPTSATGSPPGLRLVGSNSPSIKAPIAPQSGLGRKESKWRRSVMNFGDIGSKKKPSRQMSTREAPSTRNMSIREPPTSYDAYIAHQKRIANNRRSCQPTLHSQASIAAEAREIRDRDESEMAEVFFLS